MAETKTPPTFPFPGVDGMKKLIEDQSARVGQVFEEVGKAHSKWIEYSNTQMDEMNDLMKSQFNYMNELAAGWRKLSMETLKKGVDSVTH